MQTILVLLGVSILVFALVRVIPGDPVRLMVGETATPDQIARTRAAYGLDQPIWVQYLVYVRDIAQGNLGQSLRYQQPVTGLVLNSLPATAQLALATVVLSVVIGVPLGILAALHKHSALDNVLLLVTLVGQAMPTFWWGIVLIIIFAVTLRLLPTSGAGSPQQLILPAVTLSTYITALIARLTRSSVSEVMDQDFIRTARSKGLPERAVVLAHGLKNAAIPIVTVIGLQVGNLLGGAVITETVFGWPGVGLLSINAIYNRDYPVLQAAVLLSALVFLVINLLLDFVYVALDPRIRYT